MSLEKLTWAAIISFVLSLLLLLGGGYLAKDQLPPYPGKVVDPAGKILFQIQLYRLGCRGLQQILVA